MTSLQPVYQKVKLVDEEMISLEEMSDTANKNIADQSSPGSEACCSDATCKKGKKKPSLGKRLCFCACGFLAFGIALWMLAGLAVFSYAGAKTYRCMYPRHKTLTIFTFDDDEVSEFDLGVVSGQIIVKTCSKIENTTLYVTQKASSPDLLKTMPLQQGLKSGVFYLNALMPSFDFHHCQQAVVELIIPDRLAKTQHYSLSAQTILGTINLNAPRHAFNKISLSSKVGMIKAKNVHALGSFEADARVGLVRVNRAEAQSTSFTSTVGIVRAFGVKSASSAEIFVETGKATVGFMSAPSVTLKSEIGHIDAYGFSTVRNIDGRIAYGRLNFASDFKGDFLVESPYGFIDVAHAKEATPPTINVNTPAMIAGTTNNGQENSADDGDAQVNLQGVYAELNLFIPKSRHH